MKNETRIEQVTRFNDEVIENFSEQIKAIILSGKPVKVQIKMFYKVRYWSSYMMTLNNNIIMDSLMEKK